MMWIRSSVPAESRIIRSWPLARSCSMNPSRSTARLITSDLLTPDAAAGSDTTVTAGGHRVTE